MLTSYIIVDVLVVESSKPTMHHFVAVNLWTRVESGVPNFIAILLIVSVLDKALNGISRYLMRPPTFPIEFELVPNKFEFPFKIGINRFVFDASR